MIWPFKSKEKVKVTEEDNHKIRLRCERGEWIVEEKYEVLDGSVWSICFRSEDQQEARKELQKLITKVYYIHNGVCEYW